MVRRQRLSTLIQRASLQALIQEYTKQNSLFGLNYYNELSLRVLYDR